MERVQPGAAQQESRAQQTLISKVRRVRVEAQRLPEVQPDVAGLPPVTAAPQLEQAVSQPEAQQLPDELREEAQPELQEALPELKEFRRVPQAWQSPEQRALVQEEQRASPEAARPLPSFG